VHTHHQPPICTLTPYSGTLCTPATAHRLPARATERSGPCQTPQHPPTDHLKRSLSDCAASGKMLGIILEENQGFLDPGQKTVQIYIVKAD